MKRKIGAVVALLIAGFILAGGVSAFGMKGPSTNGMGAFNATDDVRTQLDTALTNNDYDTFVSIQTSNFPNAPTLNKEQFVKIVDMHSRMQKIDDAIDAGDFAAWKTLAAQLNDPRSQQMLSKITAENFHYLKDWKDAQEKLQSIETNLGFAPFGNGFGSPKMGMMHARTNNEMHGHAPYTARAGVNTTTAN